MHKHTQTYKNKPTQNKTKQLILMAGSSVGAVADLEVGEVLCASLAGTFATPTSEFCAPVAARLNVNLEQVVDFCPGLSKFSLKTPKSQDANLAGMLRVRPNVGYGERIPASASS